MDLIDHWSENGFARKERYRSEILIRILPKERTLKLSLTLSSVPLSSIINLSFPDALDIVIYCFVFLFVSLVVVLCCLRCCYCLVFFVCLFCFVFVFNSKTILKFHSLFYVSWNDSRDRIVVSTLRCGRNNPGSNPGHGTHKTVSFFSISFFFLSFYLYPSKCSMLFLIFFNCFFVLFWCFRRMLIFCFEMIWNTVTVKDHNCLSSEWSDNVYLIASYEQQWKMFEKVNEDN